MSCLTILLICLMVYLNVSRLTHVNGPLVILRSMGSANYSFACLSSFNFAVALTRVNVADGNTSPSGDLVAMFASYFVGYCNVVGISCFSNWVNEVWYPVGSMQRRMVGWDSLGLVVYFVAPCAVLTFKGWERYGDVINASLTSFTAAYAPPVPLVGSAISPQTLVTLLFVQLAAVCGPLLSKLSVGNCCWFAKVYTHGNPNCGKVVVSVDFRDLFDTSKHEGEGEAMVMGKQHKELWSVCKELGFRLSIFVGRSELERFGEVVGELGETHCLAGSVNCTGWRESFGSVREKVGGTSELFEKVVGRKQTWMRLGGGGRHPVAFLEANARNINVAFWSCYGEVGGKDSVAPIVEMVKEDFKRTGGGNIIYLRRKGGAPGAGETLAGGLCEVLRGLKGVCEVEGLDAVVKPDHEFHLD